MPKTAHFSFTQVSPGRFCMRQTSTEFKQGQSAPEVWVVRVEGIPDGTPSELIGKRLAYVPGSRYIGETAAIGPLTRRLHTEPPMRHRTLLVLILVLASSTMSGVRAEDDRRPLTPEQFGRWREILAQPWSDKRVVKDDVPVLISIVESDSPFERAWGARNLRALGKDAVEAYPALIRALGRSSLAREHIDELEALKAIGPPAAEVAEKAAPVLAKSARSAGPTYGGVNRVALLSVEVLGSLGPPALSPLGELATDHADVLVRREAEFALARRAIPAPTAVATAAPTVADSGRSLPPTPVAPAPVDPRPVRPLVQSLDFEGSAGTQLGAERWLGRLAVTLICFGLAALAALSARYQRRRSNQLSDLPTGPIGDLRPGPVKFRGRVEIEEPPLISPLSGCACAAYRFLVTVNENDGSSVVVDKKNCLPLFLGDGSGRVAIMPNAILRGANPTLHPLAGLSREERRRFREMIADRYAVSSDPDHYGEWVLAPGVELFAAGTLLSEGEGLRLVPGEAPSFVTELGEEHVLRAMQDRFRFARGCSVILSLLGPLGLVPVPRNRDWYSYAAVAGCKFL